jgi:uncharacterized phage-associated protein
MPAPFSVKAVANAILGKSFADKRPVSPLKLQKLLYYAHGYYSAAYGQPLVDEAFEAWQYGPVVPAVYHEFKDFGNSPITREATDFGWDDEEPEVIPVPPLFDDPRVKKVIDYVWKQYAPLSAVILSEMTHRPDSPWDRTMKTNKFGLKNMDIPQSLIEDYFGTLVKKTSQAA